MTNEPTQDTSGDKYNQSIISENDREKFTAEVTDKGVYLDHSMINGCLFLSHGQFEQLNAFRLEFLDEINYTE